MRTFSAWRQSQKSNMKKSISSGHFSGLATRFINAFLSTLTYRGDGWPAWAVCFSPVPRLFDFLISLCSLFVHFKNSRRSLGVRFHFFSRFISFLMSHYVAHPDEGTKKFSRSEVSEGHKNIYFKLCVLSLFSACRLSHYLKFISNV